MNTIEILLLKARKILLPRTHTSQKNYIDENRKDIVLYDILRSHQTYLNEPVSRYMIIFIINLAFSYEKDQKECIEIYCQLIDELIEISEKL